MEKTLDKYLSRRNKKWQDSNKVTQVSDKHITVKLKGREFTWDGKVDAMNPHNIHVTLTPYHNGQVVRLFGHQWSEVQMIKVLDY